MDPLDSFKAAQKLGWAHFTPLETFTTIPAARLVKRSGIRAGDRVLDVACGTGVVATTAARLGARLLPPAGHDDIVVLPHQTLVDLNSAEYKSGGWAHRSFQAREELLEHPGLVKVPILRAAPKAVVGFNEAAWKALAGTK